MRVAVELPPLPQSLAALFLDFDGTLTELALRPEDVSVSPALIALLQGLANRLSGALAIVSGRRLTDLDYFLAPLLLPAAAEHGALRRTAAGQLTGVRAPDLGLVIRVAEDLVRRHPGLQLERKTRSVALHYRQRPELARTCLAALALACEHTPGTELQQGQCVLELKPLGVGKAQALASFMQEPPFAGRQPWFAGDDLTDESGFAWVQRMGGTAIKVGAGASAAAHRCDSPDRLRHWLAQALLTRAPGTAGRV